MSTFRSMAGMVFGMGINPELDSLANDSNFYNYYSEHNEEPNYSPTEKLIEKLKNDSWSHEFSVKDFEESGFYTNMCDNPNSSTLCKRFGSNFVMEDMVYEDIDLSERILNIHV